MKKTIKKLIIGIILLLIILIILLMLFNNPRINNDYAYEQDTPAEIFEEEINNKIRRCDIDNNYFIVKNIINKYNSYCQNLLITADDIEVYKEATNEEELKKYKEEQAEQRINLAKDYIYNMIDDSYINEYKVSMDNVDKKLGITETMDTIIIENMYMIENTDTISTYFVEGTNINTETAEKKEIYLAVNLNINDYTFSIYPEEYCRKHGYDKIEEGEYIEIPISSIENRKYNTYDYIPIILDEDIAKEYYNNYKYSMLYNTEYAYDMLDKEYRQKRFGSLDKYKEYINENSEILGKCIISKYQVTGNEGEKRYICLDNYGNYYIFNQKNISDYTIYLDTYTIGTEEFFEKYNNGSDETKAGMNAEKFFEALNMKDYTFIYEHLAQSFKDNYFESQEKLKSYLEQNLFVYNSARYKNYSKEEDINVLEIDVSDKYEENESKKMTIVIKLEENTDFVMSFSIQ